MCVDDQIQNVQTTWMRRKGGIATWVLTCQNQNGVVIDRGNQANLRPPRLGRAQESGRKWQRQRSLSMFRVVFLFSRHAACHGFLLLDFIRSWASHGQWCFRALSLSYLGAHSSQGYRSWRDVALRTVSEETIVLGVRGGGRWAKYYPPSSSRKTLKRVTWDGDPNAWEHVWQWRRTCGMRRKLEDLSLQF